MMMSYVDILITLEEYLRKYVESLVSLLTLLSPEILLHEGVNICLWKDYMGMRFDMQFSVRFDHPFP